MEQYYAERKQNDTFASWTSQIKEQELNKFGGKYIPEAPLTEQQVKQQIQNLEKYNMMNSQPKKSELKKEGYVNSHGVYTRSFIIPRTPTATWASVVAATDNKTVEPPAYFAAAIDPAIPVAHNAI